MWNRRKEEEHTPKPASAPPTTSELAKEGIPMSTLPGRTAANRMSNRIAEDRLCSASPSS